ncbi:MAG: hypothetical protein ABI678_31525 [Kofleriaceae bacterium]
MYESRTTAEFNCEELAGLLATERITAKMPAVRLEQLTMEMSPIVDKPAEEPSAPAYARGGTALPFPAFPRFAVIAISAALTVITVLGLATVI